MKLPVWIAGTCSWGHFDHIGNEAFSEDLIRVPMDGAAAIITTTRLITITSNQNYTEDLFRSIFPNFQITSHPIGDIFQSVKTGASDGELFILFGDPAIHIALAMNPLSSLSVESDTLKTLELANFSGNQDVISGTGSGIVTLRDADRPVTRHYTFLNTDQSISFTLPGATLFRGQIQFDGNQFSGSVRVPNDISYSSNPGFLSLYLWHEGETLQETMGSIGGLHFIAGDPSQDHQGPQISYESESGRSIGNGDHLFSDENLLIRLSDPLGINLTGEIGHSIQVAFNDETNPIDFSDRFIYDPNSVTTGTMEILNTQITDGDQLHVESWDNANNFSQSDLTIYKTATSGLKLLNVINFPNPFKTETKFTFELSQGADVTIDVYTLEGRKILSLGPQSMDAGFNTWSWSGRDAYGQSLANGVYLYRIKAKNESGSAMQIERIAKYE